ncbi:Zn-dependent hydrolase [Paenibacillus sp. 1P07SE]|uniref:Zn-dependent hydrolase n=1 Tax=Paenibacillus sp. 1P07SE TaxID=3132209 RepID=UPI0039A615C0
MEQEVLSHPQEQERLLARLETEVTGVLEWLSAYSEGDGAGVTRLLYTKPWLAAQQALAARMAGVGLETAYDEVGNLYGKLPGRWAEAPSIVTGSHIDTVIQGGKYDGAYGIAAGLVALEYLHRRYGKPLRSLEVVSLCEEEGSRFPLAYWGSGNIVGKRSHAQIAALTDSEGRSFPDAMAACGFGPGSARPALRRDIAAFVEAHIEQGGVLESEALGIGIVDSIAGQRRVRVELTGEANHAGTTPMHLRRDALEGAGLMIHLLRQEAIRRGAPLVATVGKLQVFPNVPNVVPGRVQFTVDARHTDDARLDDFCEWMRTTFAQLAEQRGLTVSFDEWFREEAVPLDSGLQRKLERICSEQGIPARRISSGAGHDAQMFGGHCRTALLFVPSRRGISHAPEEYTSPRELAVGVLVLAELLYKLGYEEEEQHA